MTKYWTGVGSREVSEDIAALQVRIGEVMASKGYTLRSGAAQGSDFNFHQGVFNGNPLLSEIWIPWNGFMKDERPSNGKGSTYIIPDKEDFEVARKHYLDTGIISWFDNMKQGAQKLHGRNYFQVHGFNDELSKVCIYAAKESKFKEESGGTRSAVMLSRLMNVPCYNLLIEEQKVKLCKLLGIEL